MWLKALHGTAAATTLVVLPGFTAVTYTVSYGQSTFAGSPVTYGAADGGLVCMLRYNTSTNQVEWVRTGGTVYGARYSNSRVGTNVKGAVLDPAGNVYIAGEYYGPAQFGAVSLGLTNGQNSTYLAKLDQTVLPTRAATAGKAWRVYPNPARSAAQLEGLPARTTVRVLDALGREVRRT